MLDRTKKEAFIQYTIRLPKTLDDRMYIQRAGDPVQQYVLAAILSKVQHDEQYERSKVDEFRAQQAKERERE